MARGDHVKMACRGGLYWHHGIDVGNGLIVSNTQNGVVLETLAQFCGEADCPGPVPVRVVYIASQLPHSPRKIAAKALHHVGSNLYCLLRWNCEHFAVYCCAGVGASEQLTGRGWLALSAGLLAALFPPATPAGLALLRAGGVLLGTGGTKQLYWGTGSYAP